MNDKLDRLELVRSAWDAYDPDYMDFPLQANPDPQKDFAEGGDKVKVETHMGQSFFPIDRLRHSG